MIEGALAIRGLRIEEPALVPRRHRHPDGRGETLAERAGCGLDAGSVAEFRVARGTTAPRAEGLKVLHGEAVPGEEQLAVEGKTRVAGRQDEPITAEPARVARIMAHDTLEEHVRGRRQGHCGAGVPVSDLLHGVHRECAQVLHRRVIGSGPVQLGALMVSGSIRRHTPTLAN